AAPRSRAGPPRARHERSEAHDQGGARPGRGVPPGRGLKMMPFSLRRNIRLKSFSFLIALIWWAVVHGEDARIKDFVVPIDYINLAQSLEQSGRVIDTVT